MNMEILFGILLGAFLILCIAFFLFRQSPKETLRVKDVYKRQAKAIEETGYVAKAMKKAVEEEVKIEKKKRVLKKQSTVNRGYRIALLCDQVMLPRTREILDAICKELYTQGCLLQVDVYKRQPL